MIYVLVLFVVVVVVAVWHIKRKAKEREAASANRMKAMMDAMQSAKMQTPQSVSVSTPTSAAATTVPKEVTTPRTGLAEFVAHASVLDTQALQWYGALREALPMSVVIPRASLASFVRVGDAIGGFEREARERRLASAMVDFLVCDQALCPLAVICLAEASEFVKSTCERVKLRLVTPTSRDNLRQQVLGA